MGPNVGTIIVLCASATKCLYSLHVARTIFHHLPSRPHNHRVALNSNDLLSSPFSSSSPFQHISASYQPYHHTLYCLSSALPCNLRHTSRNRTSTRQLCSTFHTASDLELGCQCGFRRQLWRRSRCICTRRKRKDAWACDRSVEPWNMHRPDDWRMGCIQVRRIRVGVLVPSHCRWSASCRCRLLNSRKRG